MNKQLKNIAIKAGISLISTAAFTFAGYGALWYFTENEKVSRDAILPMASVMGTYYSLVWFFTDLRKSEEIEKAERYKKYLELKQEFDQD